MGCPSCPEITLSDVGDELLAQLGGRRYPLGATFELTERCNLRCLHCYIKQPAGSPLWERLGLAVRIVAGGKSHVGYGVGESREK